MNGVTDYSAAFRGCLETLDVALMRKLWRYLRPDLPQPDNDDEALATLHLARTECDAIRPQLRMYSHCWLKERSLPSRLPDQMRASAERMFPRVVRAVGISINSHSPLVKAVLPEVRAAVVNAVLDIHADDPDLSDSDLVKRRMQEVRRREYLRLLGSVRWQK